jgi:Tfp pilus assembly protein PilN
MKREGKKALGIDVCRNAVSFVELQKNDQQIKVVRTGSVPIDNVIADDGSIQAPTVLAGAIKKFKIAGSLRHSNAVLTICAEPVLLQILTLPDSSPAGAKRFIHNEIRQYAILPLKDVEMDYCGLKSSDAQAKRVLVGASQAEHLSMTVKAIAKDNIDVLAIEPAVTAFISICYDGIIRPAREKNIILLLIRDDIMNLCVFEKQKLEFLRIKKFEADIAASQHRSDWLRGEIESVIQFHELEKQRRVRGWQIIVACCPDNKYSAEIAGEIKSRIPQQNVEVAAFANSMVNLAVDGKNNAEILPVAAGAAMKLLEEDASGIKLNLLPKGIFSVRKTRKEIFIIVNVAACLLVLLFLYIGLLSKKSINIGLDIYTKKQKQLNVNVTELIKSKKDISEKASRTENGVASVQQAFEYRSYHDWAKILAELAEIVPQTVLIQSLQGKGDDIIEIQGLAVNFEAVNNFLGLLGKSREMSSASLTSVGQNTQSSNGLIDYSIECSLRAVAELAQTSSQ